MPAPPPVPFADQALALLGQGRTDDAAALCLLVLRDAVATEAAVPPLQILARAAFVQGRLPQARKALCHALAIDPANPQAWSALGAVHHAAGLVAPGLTAMERAFHVNATLVDVVLNLTNGLMRAGQAERAAAVCRQSIAAGGTAVATLHTRLAEVLRALDDPDGVLAAAREAIHHDSTAGPAHLAAAWALIRLGDLDGAERRMADCLSLVDPTALSVWLMRGALVGEQGCWPRAARILRRAAALAPGQGAVWRALARALGEDDRVAAATRAAARATILEPAEADGWHLRARLLLSARYNRTAARMSRTAAVPDGADAIEGGQCENAFRRALALAPDSAPVVAEFVFARLQQVVWAGLERWLARGRHLAATAGPGGGVAPFLSMVVGASASEQFRCARQTAGTVAQRMQSRRAHLGLSHARPRGPLIRVGYLSADFGDHATSYLIAGLMERHDRTQFSIHAYSIGPAKEGDWRRRIEEGVDSFTDLHGLSHEDAARRIHADAIDILIDLKGYTHQGRPEILALRPAPVQIAWLGYPGTTGAACIDFAILDSVVAPPPVAAWFSEQILFLPTCYQINDPQRPRPPAPDGTGQWGLPAGGVVLAAFHSAYKITPMMFAAWMEVLRAVPGAVLWLLDESADATLNLKRAAAAAGIDPARLVFAPLLPLEEHLVRYHAADLFLDSAPVSAHTTASDALWMGCPVVTCAGPTMVGRVAASLLHACGVPELVGAGMADYRAIALRLAGDPAARAAVRARLSMAWAGGPFDAARTAAALEAAYRRAWVWMQGGVPVPDAAPRRGFRILRMEPAGYVHGGAFDETAEGLGHALAALGHAVETVRGVAPQPFSLSPTRTNILLGLNLIPPESCPPLPADTIVVNLEPLTVGSRLVTPFYLDFLYRHTVWDYSAANIAFLRRAGLGRDAHFVPPGHVPELARIMPAAEQPVDVLFYGSLNPRRIAILDALRAHGLAVTALTGVYGAERDSWIARAKTVLCLHYYEGNSLETVRLSYLLTNGKAVVAEAEAGEVERAGWTGGVLAVSYEGLVTACVALVADASRRRSLEAAARQVIARRPLTEALALRVAVRPAVP